MPKPDFTNLTPEEQKEWETENKRRLSIEDLEDMLYQQREKAKLKKELETTKERPQRKPKDLSKIEQERQQVEEFMAQQQKEQGKKQKEERALEKLMADPSIIQSPSEPVCINQIGGKQCGEPAAVKLLHGGLLGDTPPITLCKDCAKLLKLINIGEKDPELEGRLRRKKLEKEISDLEKKRKKQKGQGSAVSPSLSLRRSMVELADKLDRKGLHKEADILDSILGER